MTDKPPVLRPGKAEKSLAAETAWEPNDLQRRVKARFWRRMEEMSHIYDREDALKSRQVMLELAGTDRIFDWANKPGFMAWFVDADYIGDLIQSETERNVKTLISIRDEEDTADGDRIKAARTLLELADAFPGKKSEVRFIDDQLEEMPDRDVDRETKALRAKLAEIEGDT